MITSERSPEANSLPLVCTVVGNNVSKWNQVTALFGSLLRRGGAMRACERVAYFHSEIMPEPAEALAALGVALKVVNRESCDAADGLIPAFLDPEETKFLVALAPEMTVKSDFFEWIDDTPLAAQRAAGDRFGLEVLKAARDAFGTSFVLYDTRALFVRRDIARALGTEWIAALREVRRLLVQAKNLPLAAAQSVALGIALLKIPIEIRELPAAGPAVCAGEEIMSEAVVDLVRISRHFNLDFDNASFW